MTLTQWVTEMRGLLDQLSTSAPSTVQRNDVGNLVIRDEQGEYVGFIDVLWPSESTLDEAWSTLFPRPPSTC